MSARTPAATAMAAMTLDHLSGGRLILGLGVSGPQVVEGWYGQAYGKPLARTREYVDIVRRIIRREEPINAHGEFYDMPYTGADGKGLGKPLKIINHPLRSDIPIWWASLKDMSVAATAEMADGWLPIMFIPEKYHNVWGPQLKAGLANRPPNPTRPDPPPRR
eukprot:gene23099-43538_t